MCNIHMIMCNIHMIMCNIHMIMCNIHMIMCNRLDNNTRMFAYTYTQPTTRICAYANTHHASICVHTDKKNHLSASVYARVLHESSNIKYTCSYLTTSKWVLTHTHHVSICIHIHTHTHKSSPCTCIYLLIWQQVNEYLREHKAPVYTRTCLHTQIICCHVIPTRAGHVGHTQIHACLCTHRQAGMIGFITPQQSAPSQMTLQDSNASRKH
jgi:hypothetical protein